MRSRRWQHQPRRHLPCQVEPSIWMLGGVVSRSAAVMGIVAVEAMPVEAMLWEELFGAVEALLWRRCWGSFPGCQHSLEGVRQRPACSRSARLLQ